MKNIDNLLETLAQKVADQDISAGKELDEILEYYSTKISKSIQPLNEISAPFVYRNLVEYAKAIQKHFPEEVKISDSLGEACIVTIKF